MPAASAPALTAARSAGLVYVSDDAPGFHRERRRGRFVVVDERGSAVRQAAVLERIAALAIPPAWNDVWICRDPDGHLQATGRDARGRKQYRYHARWRRIRDETKFARLPEFAAALPSLRKRIARDLSRPGLPIEKVAAVVVRLLERTLIRIGNDEYARDNESYGLTTLHDEHVRVRGDELVFRFRGKSGKEHRIGLRDARAARIVRRCRELPGQELFQYVGDDGETRSIGSSDVNDYLREATGSDFTAKDFRTWAGTVLAAMALAPCDPPETEAEARRTVNAAVEQVASALGNTRTVARNCYVHPAIVDAYTEGRLTDRWDELLKRSEREGLAPEEVAVAELLV